MGCFNFAETHHAFRTGTCTADSFDDPFLVEENGCFLLDEVSQLRTMVQILLMIQFQLRKMAAVGGETNLEKQLCRLQLVVKPILRSSCGGCSWW